MPDRTLHTPPAPARARDWAPRFLEALEDTSLVAEAAKKAGIARRTVYDRRAKDAAFADAWDEVLERSTDILEQICVRRAAEGSDQLLTFLLRSRRPEVYSERYRVQHQVGTLGLPPIALTKEGSDAAHEFLAKINAERESLSDVLRTRPVARR